MGLPFPRKKQVKATPMKRSSTDVYMDELTKRLARVDKYLPAAKDSASV